VEVVLVVELQQVHLDKLLERTQQQDLRHQLLDQLVHLCLVVALLPLVAFLEGLQLLQYLDKLKLHSHQHLVKFENLENKHRLPVLTVRFLQQWL
jgi:hypothetical protein